ncbi:tetratricopeptide repeat protein [Fibrella sp. HMF5335]|uniref:Tetratricopeptide repeat protein n=1 Tax=Fibrella rubiginis TaxID=2817060 RepID=A0A939K5V2_9BACT|nr:tetratricopeptide repeat-containing sensor histidine kinase [Fibrella rubiginis]MBO0937646.1 tetratricopeptide repeat protein [Fibrella rubiginis]
MQRIWLHILLFLLGAATTLNAQSYKTPTFNFDRGAERTYVDSLLHLSRQQVWLIGQQPASPTADTARMEWLHFMATVYHNSFSRRDSSRVIARQLAQLAQRKRNIKYQLKALQLLERYYRSAGDQFTEALRLNFQMLKLVENNPPLANMYTWRIYRNLGKINTSLDQHAEAVMHLLNSLTWFDKDPRGEQNQLADLHQSLANVYLLQGKLTDAETHFIKALARLDNQHGSLSSLAYLSNDLGRLYIAQHKPAVAVAYLKRAIMYWGQLSSPMPQSDALADIAEAYVALGQPDDAIANAKQALAQNKVVFAVRRTALAALVGAYQLQHDWKNALDAQTLYLAVKADEQQAKNRTEALRQNAIFERERLETTYQHAHQLQEQRYQTLAREADIARLNNAIQTSALQQQSQTNALRFKLEKEALKTAATQRQLAQQATIKQLTVNELTTRLASRKRLQNTLVMSLTMISGLGLLLLYYSFRLRRTNRALRAKNAEIEAALLKGQRLERKRVATELHDRVSSLLGATKMTIQTIDADTLPPRAKKLYENSLFLLDDAAKQVRQLSHNLLPSRLREQGLVRAIDDLVARLNLADQTEFSFSYPDTDRLPLSETAEFNLYVICLELCTNIIRHAQASHARIELTKQENGLQLVLQDDGVGIHNSASGMGLTNIRERAQQLGGYFYLESIAGAGTQTTILVPVS